MEDPQGNAPQANRPPQGASLHAQLPLPARLPQIPPLVGTTTKLLHSLRDSYQRPCSERSLHEQSTIKVLTRSR